MDGIVITVSETRYKELLRVEEKLNALLAHGVDNWEGYSDAINSVNDEKEESYEEIYGPE